MKTPTHTETTRIDACRIDAWLRYAAGRPTVDAFSAACDGFAAGWRAGAAWAQKQAKRAREAEKARKR